MILFPTELLIVQMPSVMIILAAGLKITVPTLDPRCMMERKKC